MVPSRGGQASRPVSPQLQRANYFSGLFGGFYRRGGLLRNASDGQGAAILGEPSISQPQAAKWVRTILRIAHQAGKSEPEEVAERPVVSSVEPSGAIISCLQFPVWWTYGESDPDLVHLPSHLLILDPAGIEPAIFSLSSHLLEFLDRMGLEPTISSMPLRRFTAKLPAH